jgi:hypothetical protein
MDNQIDLTSFSGTHEISASMGSVHYQFFQPLVSKAVLTLAHGAGAGMNHPFLVSLSHALAKKNIGTLRFNFPYMELAKKRPDSPAVAEATVARIAELANRLFKHVPVFYRANRLAGECLRTMSPKKNRLLLMGLSLSDFPYIRPANPPQHAQNIFMM